MAMFVCVCLCECKTVFVRILFRSFFVGCLWKLCLFCWFWFISAFPRTRAHFRYSLMHTFHGTNLYSYYIYVYCYSQLVGTKAVALQSSQRSRRNFLMVVSETHIHKQTLKKLQPCTLKLYASMRIEWHIGWESTKRTEFRIKLDSY